jgi:hypothetical protein
MAFTTRPQYLRASLSPTYGCEIIFVGSGGMIDYPNREQAEHNLQDELAVMIRQHEAPLAPRPAAPNPLLAAAKRAVKRAVGRVEVDLYDLGAWTVWAAPRAVSEPPRVEAGKWASAIDRMQAKLQEIKKELRERMHQPFPNRQWLKQIVTSYFSY